MTRSVQPLLDGVPPEYRQRMRELAKPVRFPDGARLFEEGARADRFWVIRVGRVALDAHVPGRRPAVVARLGSGELLGWSWMLRPYVWHLGAQADGVVEADEFDAEIVRALCESDPVLGRALYRHVAAVLAHRLQASRARLLDLYGPQGSGVMP